MDRKTRRSRHPFPQVTGYSVRKQVLKSGERDDPNPNRSMPILIGIHPARSIGMVGPWTPYR